MEAFDLIKIYLCGMCVYSSDGQVNNQLWYRERFDGCGS